MNLESGRGRDFFLNLESGLWEYGSLRTPMTDSQYHRAMEKVRRYAKERKQQFD
ncbi:hypothetical protein HOLleu_02946 [Holothuria leucospilota]|uniref:Uncharacterized protein n=1 Tax=Holothuria leucospilota TaxID=206669 RepID=A0A9Q1HL47_HOLLE|nr:hypothetical protein HOLleu_02946 [Holothuria leucospilota]